MSGPLPHQSYEAWLMAAESWRSQLLALGNYQDLLKRSVYLSPHVMDWTPGSFVHPLAMVHDRMLFDAESNSFTVDKFLADLSGRYGPIDAVLLWHSYPNMGVDDRNQYEMLRSMPGGLPALARLVEAFHARGVRVTFPFNPWDTGTRPADEPAPLALAALMAKIDADGVFGDTLGGVAPCFFQASALLQHPLSYAPEGSSVGWCNLADSVPPVAGNWSVSAQAAASLPFLASNAAEWAEGWIYPAAPAASTSKWLEPRHQVHLVNRWATDHTDDLQSAFFNGAGFVPWENIWGIWNGMSPRDAEALRRTATILRAFAPQHLHSPQWLPFYPLLQPPCASSVFASAFPTPSNGTLFLLVNRSPSPLVGCDISATESPGSALDDGFLWDLYSGAFLGAWRDRASIALQFGANDYGALYLNASQAASGDLQTLLARMAALTVLPLSSFNQSTALLPQALLQPGRVSSLRPAAPPPGMLAIPAAASFWFNVSGIEIEGDNLGVDVQYPWESLPQRHHSAVLAVAGFFIDQFLVTNADYAAYLRASGYRPDDPTNYLRNWNHSSWPPTPPLSQDDQPVTWVSYEEAALYCTYFGKRLPFEWEWQYAAQGTDGRQYPWGSTWDSALVPPPQTGRTLREIASVYSYPNASSPFGVQNLAGYCWQWTDCYQDDHTRAAILRGGSIYSPQSNSPWYFPNSQSLDNHAKLLLMAPSMDRSGGISFRCVVDQS